MAEGIGNARELYLVPPNRPSPLARVRIVAIDNAFNMGFEPATRSSRSRAAGGIAPTTLRDFDMPGTPAGSRAPSEPASACSPCHGNYDAAVEPYAKWQGSMMSQASRDLLFEANMVVANQDPRLRRPVPALPHFCAAGWRPVRAHGRQPDLARIRTEYPAISAIVWSIRSMILVRIRLKTRRFSPAGLSAYELREWHVRRSTRPGRGAARSWMPRPATRSWSHLSTAKRPCAGRCHDVSNTAFEKDGQGNYVPNAFDAPATDFSAHTVLLVERTYSEWFYSEYNSPGGVYAPQFGATSSTLRPARTATCAT